MKIKCYYNYSTFGDSVSIATHEEIFDSIEMELPEGITTYEAEGGLAFRTSDGNRYFIYELFQVRSGRIYANWYDGYNFHRIECKYRKAA